MEINRGSEWHKWDFHVHTPYSLLNNGYGFNPYEIKDNPITLKDNFDEYVKRLFQKAIDNNISAIGITDYFVIDGYEYIHNNYLTNFECLKKLGFRDEDVEKIKNMYIFPNIELRTDNFVGKKTKSVNLHVIFSNEVNINDIKCNFLNKLYIGEEKFTLNTINIEKIGEKIKQINGSSNNSLKCGFENITIKLEDVVSSIKQHFEKSAFLLVPVDEDLSKIDWNGRDYLTRKKYYSNADMYLTANEKTIQWALGGNEKKERINEFGSIKPCVWGSDAHSYDKMFEIDNNKFCWIKSKLYFDGLKQVLYEPEDRVKIGQKRPDDSKANYNIIDYIELLSDDGKNLFQKEKIYFNENLNCIIGGKSTGKSLLLYKIAEAIDENNIKDKLYEDLNIKLFVNWRNTTEDKKRKIIYIPQSYLINIFRSEDKTEVYNHIRDTLLENYEIRKIYADFEKEIAIIKSEIDKMIDILIVNENKLLEKENELQDIGNSKLHEKEIEHLKASLSNDSKTNITDDDIENYNTIDEEIKSKLQVCKILNEKIESLKKYYNFKIIIDETARSDSNFDAQEDGFGIEVYNSFPYDEYYNDVSEFVEEMQKSIKDNWNKGINKLIDNSSEILKKNEDDIKKLQIKYDILNTKISAYNEVKEKSDRINDEKNKQSVAIAIEREIKKLNEHISLLRGDLINKFNSFEEKYQCLQQQFNNLVAEYADSNLDFQIYKNMKQISSSQIFNFFDKRYLASSSKVNLYKDVDLTIDNIVEIHKLLDDKVIFTKAGYKKQDVLNYIYTMPFDVCFDIVTDGDSLFKVSPGKRAKIMLDLIINMSQQKCPILIDQPEDDLDNRSIYEDLVKYIKNKKKDRQFIIVTHNANLVIGSDSEEIIIANYDSANSRNEKFKFEYRVGCIEDNSIIDKDSQAILKKEKFQEQICKILEGGKEAFKSRENKYFF